MAERGIAAVRAHLAKLPPPGSLTFEELRASYDRAERAFPTPPDVSIERVTAPKAPAEWLRPPGAGPAVVLYLHGGGYVIGSPRSHRHLAAAIARAAGARALLLDYRRAPEHPFPAAVDDALAAYRWLLGSASVAPGAVVVAGDSAGGGLTVATLLAARDAGLPPPAAGVCVSPWVDLTCSLGTYRSAAI
jgi:phosphinothricin tripeptide acetyl hydrolase